MLNRRASALHALMCSVSDHPPSCEQKQQRLNTLVYEGESLRFSRFSIARSQFENTL